jgi:hypothetical protein
MDDALQDFEWNSSLPDLIYEMSFELLINNHVRCYGILKFLKSIYVNSHIDYNQAKDNQV